MGSVAIPLMKTCYVHHQDSLSSNSMKYTDFIPEPTHAETLPSQQTVNNQDVSTIQGGCYTTPYYYYRWSHTVTYTCVVTGYTYSGDQWVDQIVYKRSDGVTGYRGVSLTEQQARAQYPIGSTFTTSEPVTSNGYGTTLPSGATILATYYLKTCGHTNGEVLSVHKRPYISTS